MDEIGGILFWCFYINDGCLNNDLSLQKDFEELYFFGIREQDVKASQRCFGHTDKGSRYRLTWE